MDPNVTLSEIRDAVAAAAVAADNLDEAAEHDAMLDVVQGFRALDEWIRSGGFLPSAWNRP